MLRGFLLNKEASGGLSTTSHVVTVFISSTFTDTKVRFLYCCVEWQRCVSETCLWLIPQNERDYLIEHVDPLLRNMALRFGLDYEPSEMRWGINKFATERHETSAICMSELRRCQEVSAGGNYVLILGNK